MLIAGELAGDNELSFVIHSLTYDFEQASPAVGVHPLDLSEVDTYLDLGGDLVDILAAGTRCPYGVDLDGISWDYDATADVYRIRHLLSHSHNIIMLTLSPKFFAGKGNFL